MWSSVYHRYANIKKKNCIWGAAFELPKKKKKEKEKEMEKDDTEMWSDAERK